ncbi:MAG TPA: FlgD immunoglobulin-like domain containing protein, partial [Ignavibacteriaceae bacterium]|nr:FlgD immunoglobulin-like domain containing protein [Ignavibacteriaceae bacterium]
SVGNLYAVTGSSTQLNNLIQIDTTTGVGTLVGSVGYPNLTGLAFLPSGPNSVDENISEIPDQFILNQNYPNPFNPSTSIEFALPIPSDVQLVVYNLLGETVITLLNNNLSSGYHKIEWNSNDKSGNKVSSGIYFYELRAKGNNGENYSQFKKMILLK